MLKVELTEDEFHLIKRSITSLYRTRCIPAKGAQRLKHEFTTTNALYKKVEAATGPAPYILNLNRREIRCVEAIARASFDLINTRTLPGYQQRIDTAPTPALAERYKKYLAKTEEVRDGLVVGLITKLEDLL
jgi:hypothetical protein